MKVVWGIGLVVMMTAPATAFEDRPYAPAPFANCEGEAGLSTAASDSCLSITGRVLWAYQGRAVDGRWPVSQSNLFFRTISQTQNGPVKTVIGFEGWDGPDIDWQNNWTWIYRSDVRLTDAFVTFGDDVRVTAGARDDRWGSVVDMANSETYWTGDIPHTGQYFSGTLFDWAHGPQLGGHVIQIEADISNGVSLIGAAESLDKSGNIVALARYDSSTLNAYAGIMSSGFLGANTQTTALNAGLRATYGDTDVLAHAAASWHGPISVWTVNGIIDHAIGNGGLVGTAWAVGAYDSTGRCWGVCIGNPKLELSTAAGITAYLDLNSAVRAEIGGQLGSDSSPWGVQDFRTLATKITLKPLEFLEVSGEVGAIWQTHSSPFFSGTWDDTYVEGQARWSPGGGLLASAKGRRQGNGAYSYTLKAEKRF